MDLNRFVEGLAKTKLLYLDDSYLSRFEAKVVRKVREKRNCYVALDRTVFHPKSGGQPSDTGELRGPDFRMRVKKCMFCRGVVVHYGKLLDGEVADVIEGEIDWEWRYLVMKRHTAGHLLDGCISEVTGEPVRTLDSWLGDPCYVSYRGEALGKADMDRVEEMANERIAQGGSVTIAYMGFEELMRRVPNAPNIFRLPKLEVYRVVTIEGFDPIPCGGTHVRDIAEIGGVKIKEVTLDSDSFRVYYDVPH